MPLTPLLAAVLLLVSSAVPALAQDRPFIFSITTPTDVTRNTFRLDYDAGVGERAFQSDTANQPEQRIGVQASIGRLTFVGQFGLSTTNDGSAYQSSQQGEVFVSLLDPSAHSGVAFAAGGGVLHEADGVDVALSRIVAGREAESWRLHGNVLLEMPMHAPGRDAVDVITTVGWAAKLTSALALGVEGVGEDLEGFWDPTEAEGGARMLVGPAVHVAPRGARWQFNAVGGPAFHPDNTGRSSAALRDLPPATQRVGYAVKVGLTYRLD
ncbi:MAG TPA: hypothetical protein VFA27_01490 [Vicinamibacterales bacterium]|nr:hypothetical protein [Vicinamibacterales bacterium]